MEKMHGEQVWGDHVSSVSTNFTADAARVQLSPSLPRHRSRPVPQPPGMAAHVAPSMRKILPSTSPSKPELPKLSTPRQSSMEAFLFPNYLSNPH